MLDVQSVGQLARILGISPRKLYTTADQVDALIQQFELINPTNPKRKPRIVNSPTGSLRWIQAALLAKFFRQRIRPTRYSFGGVPGRSPRQNATRHIGSRFVYTTDIENFFPSISCYRLVEVFEHRLGCSADVSQLLTRLCTFDGHLAQGLITSPILADQLVLRPDMRIAGLCKSHALVYSRFVDDVTVSGSFRLGLTDSGIVELVRRILLESGFQIAGQKEHGDRISSDEISITGLRIIQGHLDVARDYIERLQKQIESHRELGLGGASPDLFFTREQLAGRVQYVCQMNKGRTRSLKQRLGLINWERVYANSIERGLIVCKKSLRAVTSPKLGVGPRHSYKTPQLSELAT